MTLLLYVAFTLSGAAGLMYEAIWSRYLGLFVGHSAYAQIIVLVIFLGGMSLGALLVGRRAERIRSPLLWYAAAELAVGLAALVFHELFRGASGWAYDTLIPALGSPAAVQAAKWTLAALLVLPQSVVLGTTFPLMSAGVIRFGRAPGRTLAQLYFANSIGASVGVLVAGFWLLGVAGLPGTLRVAGAINILVALLVGAAGAGRRERAALDARIGSGAAIDDAESGPFPGAIVADLSRGIGPTGGEAVTAVAPAEAIVAVGGGPPMIVAAAIAPAPAPAPTPTPAVVLRPLAHPADPAPAEPVRVSAAQLLLLVAFGTAVASFIYEIAWIRMLSLVLGSATHSFELMLSAFILGLALGALRIRRGIDRLERPLRTLGRVQWVMGALALATLPLYLWSFHLTATLLDALGRTDAGYRLFTAARYGIALAVMLPATWCAGMTLPLITRALMTTGAGERAIGLVYGVNTFGSIVGAALAGLVLLPWLGLQALLVSGALLDMTLGIWVLVRSAEDDAERRALPAAADRGRVIHLDHRAGSLPDAPTHRLALGAGALTIAIAAAAMLGARFDTRILTSGVYRFGSLGQPGADTVLWYQDGRTATVSVRLNRPSGAVTIATNGKPDASLTMDWLRPVAAGGQRELSGDQPTQLLLPLVTLAHAPGAREAAIIGQGSGMSSHFLLGSPTLRHLVTIDIEPEMIRASHWFQPANRRVFDDPRSSFAIDDARSYLASRRTRYDLILSEPSNPWVSGVSGLFTTEFYHRVRRYLTPTGVFGQWLHLYEIDDTLVTSVIAAVHESFPSYEIYLVSNADILIVAGNAPRLPAPDWSVFSTPGVQEDLRWVAPLGPGDLDALRLAGRDVLAPLLERRGPLATPNSDFRPALDLGAERTRYLRSTASGLTGMSAARLDVAAALSGRRRGFATVPDPAITGIPRLESLALGARLRLTEPPTDTLADDDVRDARFRVTEFRRALATDAPPSDWRRWTEAFVIAEDRLHGGTAGIADEAFYGETERYLARTRAPALPRASVQFMHALARWDWPSALGAAPLLMDAAAHGQEWVPSELLRNGAVLAGLLGGDTAAARRAYGRMAPLISTSMALESALLDAWITRAEHDPAARATPASRSLTSSDATDGRRPRDRP